LIVSVLTVLHETRVRARINPKPAVIEVNLFEIVLFMFQVRNPREKSSIPMQHSGSSFSPVHCGLELRADLCGLICAG
jgi:hypothetical protein